MNGDDIQTITIPEHILQHNLFSYCGNDPVNSIDEQGNLIWSIIEKIIVGVVLGFTKQLLSDIIQWVYELLILNRNIDFKPSKANDYLSSMLVEIGNQFFGGLKKAKAILSLITGAIGIIVRYISKIIGKRMKTSDWLNLIVAVIALVLTYLLERSSYKLRKQRNQLSAKLKKSRKNVQIRSKVQRLNLNIKYKGLAISLYIPISQELINLLVIIIR